MLREEDSVFVKWNDKEVEKQYRLKCQKCNLWVFYKHSIDSDITFIVEKSMNSRLRNPVLAARLNSQSSQASTSRDSRSQESSQKVKVTSFDEEEVEIEENEVASSYERNAMIIQQELKRRKYG